MDLERAIEIAVTAHKGQKDKAGAPYVLHPLRMMMRVEGVEAKLAAVLHDVVEDCEGWSFERLRNEGFGDEVVSAVEALSRREDESYDDFIDRAKAHPIARAVKQADLEDNMNLLRMRRLKKKDLQRLEKYHRAWHRLTG